MQASSKQHFHLYGTLLPRQIPSSESPASRGELDNTSTLATRFLTHPHMAVYPRSEFIWDSFPVTNLVTQPGRQLFNFLAPPYFIFVQGFFHIASYHLYKHIFLYLKTKTTLSGGFCLLLTLRTFD